MLALIFAKSIKDILNSIIGESLSGFMRNKQCKILDLLDYNKFIKDDSFFCCFLISMKLSIHLNMLYSISFHYIWFRRFFL